MMCWLRGPLYQSALPTCFHDALGHFSDLTLGCPPRFPWDRLISFFIYFSIYSFIHLKYIFKILALSWSGNPKGRGGARRGDPLAPFSAISVPNPPPSTLHPPPPPPSPVQRCVAVGNTVAVTPWRRARRHSLRPSAAQFTAGGD